MARLAFFLVIAVSCCTGPAVFGQQVQVQSEFAAWQGPCNLSPGSDKCGANTIALGGLFPLHRTNPDVTKPALFCDDVIQAVGFERMEAMRFAIEEINKRSDILPGITLAYEMRDSCTTPSYTNQQAVRFVQREDTTSCTSGLTPISGVVGAASSGSSIAAADLLRIFNIPQISYASTSATLSETRYDYFLRTVPPDVFQAKAIVAISHALGMRYPSVLSTMGAYGRDGAAELGRELVARGSACLAATASIGPNTPNVDNSSVALYKSVLDDLTDTVSINSSAGVAFAGRDAILGFMEYIAKFNLSSALPDKFTWFATDSWAADFDFYEDSVIAATRGTVGVAPTAAVVDRFNNHFLGLHPLNNTGPARNPWLSEFWNSTFACNPDPCVAAGAGSGPSYCEQCLGYSLRDRSLFPYTQNPKIGFVVDAVYAFARALHSMQGTLCHGTQELCKGMQARDESRFGAVDGANLLQFLKNLTFIGEAGNVVSFDASGDLESAMYQIYNMQRRNGKGSLVQVGTWEQLPHDHIAKLTSYRSSGGDLIIVACSDQTQGDASCARSRLTLNTSLIQWKDGSRGFQARPLSQCSAPCAPGHRALRIMSFPRSVSPQCCWTCKACPANTFVHNQSGVCAPCPERQRVNGDQYDCVNLPRDVFDIEDKSALACVIVASIGLAIATLLVPVIVSVMDLLFEHSVLRFSSMISVMAGAIGVFILVFLNLVPPSPAMCTVRAIWSPLSLALLLLPFLVELLDIWLDVRRYHPQNDHGYEQEGDAPPEHEQEHEGEPPITTDNTVTGTAQHGEPPSSSTAAGETEAAQGQDDSMDMVAEKKLLPFWIFCILLFIVTVVIALSLAIDLPDVEDDVAPNKKWQAGCSVSAAVFANLSLMVITICVVIGLRLYLLSCGVFVAWTFRMAAFMMVAVLLLDVCLIIAYVQLAGVVIKEAMILLIHLTTAYAVGGLVFMDLMRTLAPAKDNRPDNGRFTRAAASQQPSVRLQVLGTLSKRSLFNGTQRRNRKVSLQPSPKVALKSGAREEHGYYTAGSGDLSEMRPSAAPSIVIAAQSSQQGSGISGESGFDERADDSNTVTPVILPKEQTHRPAQTSTPAAAHEGNTEAVTELVPHHHIVSDDLPTQHDEDVEQICGSIREELSQLSPVPESSKSRSRTDLLHETEL